MQTTPSNIVMIFINLIMISFLVWGASSCLAWLLKNQEPLKALS